MFYTSRRRKRPANRPGLSGRTPRAALSAPLLLDLRRSEPGRAALAQLKAALPVADRAKVAA